MKTQIDQVLIGTVRKYGPKGEPSAYRKTVINEPVVIESHGIVGDEQADLEHHGGIDKAILHYAFDHYSHWRKDQPALEEHLSARGAFGENISSTGMTEETVCLGDRFQLGSAIVEVSQGRQPCWKLGHRFDSKEMPQQVIQTRRCGWYYRVIQTGGVQAGDVIELVERPYPHWTVSTIIALLLGTERDVKALEALGQLSVLSESWRERAVRKLRNLS